MLPQIQKSKAGKPREGREILKPISQKIGSGAKLLKIKRTFNLNRIFNGKLYCSYAQIAELMHTLDGWTTDYDPNRPIKVLYHHPDVEEPVPLHEAFSLFADRLLERACHCE